MNGSSGVPSKTNHGERIKRLHCVSALSIINWLWVIKSVWCAHCAFAQSQQSPWNKIKINYTARIIQWFVSSFFDVYALSRWHLSPPHFCSTIFFWFVLCFNYSHTCLRSKCYLRLVLYSIQCIRYVICVLQFL